MHLKAWEVKFKQMANTIGRFFTITSFGESHGKCVGAVIDGCPAGLPLTPADIQREVDRIRPGESAALTARKEKNRVEIVSGLFNDVTTGAPLAMLIWNEDVNDSDYEKLKFRPRPGHADFTAFMKYGGFNDWRGGGRFSGRITAGFVMAGAVARKLLGSLGVVIIAHTVEIGGIAAKPAAYDKIKAQADKDVLRCADPAASKKMAAMIAKTKEAGDSLGGVVECIALNVPPGLGEPVFDTLEGDLAKALFAIPAVKGVEFGAGFAAARMTGSENNDPYAVHNGKIVTAANNAGGILGGISSGMPVIARVAVKPVSSIAMEQDTVDLDKMKSAKIKVGGRHDVCIVPRAVVVVEAMMAVTLCDFALRAGVIPRVLK
jgi:chorismate synthase